jgi:transposase
MNANPKGGPMINNQATPSENSVIQQRLNLGIELSRKNWKLGFSDGKASRARVVTIAARDWDRFQREIEKARQHFGLDEGVPIRSCYEAGREGFWVHRALGQMGIENVVVDAASIDVKRRKRAKTDRKDAEQLVRQLIRYWRGERDVWSVVRVPPPDAEDARQLHRDIEVLKRERQQHRMRIQSLLFTQGLDAQVTPKLIQQLDDLRCWNRQPLPEEMKQRIRREYRRLQLAEQDLAALKRQQQLKLKKEKTVAMEKLRKLQRLRGVATTSSWVFVMEFFGWRQFRNRREVGSALGMTPTPYQSGDSAREQGISHGGNRRVRTMAVEIAWSWLRYQPDSQLSQWYQRRFGSAGARMRRIGIVAMARRLMVDLWRYVEFDIMPAGVRVKADT